MLFWTEKNKRFSVPLILILIHSFIEKFANPVMNNKWTNRFFRSACVSVFVSEFAHIRLPFIFNGKPKYKLHSANSSSRNKNQAKKTINKIITLRWRQINRMRIELDGIKKIWWWGEKIELKQQQSFIPKFFFLLRCFQQTNKRTERIKAFLHIYSVEYLSTKNTKYPNSIYRERDIHGRIAIYSIVSIFLFFHFHRILFRIKFYNNGIYMRIWYDRF